MHFVCRNTKPARAVAIALTTWALLGTAAEEVFVDPGACPGEGCGYGERWIAREPVSLRTAPGENSENSTLK